MKKDILIIFLIVLITAFLLGGTEIQSVKEYYITHIDDITPESKTVTLSINCSTILDNMDDLDPALKQSNHIPKDGIILPPTEFALREGDTVYDVLCRALRQNKIQMEYQGADKNRYNSVYIQGINYLYEFSCGPYSGWMYMVDGKFPNYGCSRYELKDGQTIQWVYTCDLGNDVGCLWMEGDEE